MRKPPTPISDMYARRKYRDFSPGVRKTGDKPPKHGPVRVIYAKYTEPAKEPAPTE